MTSCYPLTLRALVRTLAGRPACSSQPSTGTPAPVLRGAASASILEVMLYVILVAMLMVAYMPLQKKSTDTLRWNTTADQLTTVSDASKRYIQDNEETLLQTITAGHPQTISAKTLQDSGYIPAGFGLTNLSDQDWTLAVALNPKQSGKLEAFVLSANGNAISFDGMRTVSASAGGMAGYIRSSNVATGAYGGWEVNLSDYGLSAAPGHLAMYLTSDVLGTGNEASDRLYRYTVSNRPDLNTMHTAIDMGANNLNNAGTVNTKAVTASGAIQSDTLTANTSVTTNALTANNSINTNSLYANGITASGNIVASGTVNGNAVTSNGDMTANGTVTGNAVRANGRLSGGEVLQLDQVNTAGAACSPNGLVSHDVNGAILSCQSGVWKQAGKGGSTVKTGLVSNGQYVPLPVGFNQAQCIWSVSNSLNAQAMKPNYFAGEEAAVDGNRLVTCGYIDEYNFYAKGQCTYIISCENQ
ncbi:shufflon system plasmid conjugative transfer pilus tip adhesin PilV [Salmonella enterica]